jgi:hypothetical protein
MKIRLVEAQLFYAEGQTSKLIVAFHILRKVPKREKIEQSGAASLLSILEVGGSNPVPDASFLVLPRCATTTH